MSEYSDYAMIEQKLREGMHEGNMHKCIRNVMRIAGGCVAAKRITEEQCESLCDLAVSLSINKAEARRKCDEAVAFGKRQPLPHDAMPAFRDNGGGAIGWDEKVDPADYRIIDRNWLEKEDITEPSEDWNPCAQLREYLTALFEPDDHVAYCTDPYERDGKYIPTQGVCHKTVSEILKSLKKNTRVGFEEAVGTPNEKCGAWIVINPVDGHGRKNENITDFRYALVESDTKPVDEQVAIYRKLELPCVCIVHSGGKSAHAIVRINAANYDEYRKRVDFLYEVCSNNGLPVDTQNRNPSRYSRMPGVMRDGKKQFIISKACGKSSWDEWENWIKDLNDDLPDFETLTDKEFNNPPPLAPELIGGILRVNHKMCIVGPSKAGKSFLLIELAIAIAEGVEWIGHKCRQGRVLYINLELDRPSCTHRFIDVYKALGIPRKHNDFIDRWNLRGRTLTLDKLTPKLIRRAEKSGYAAIIFDPIYKVLTGDENSASDMAEFCNYFDRISHDCGCAIVYCHHHSKGGQGDKRSMDRASGSGVFARDPDAMIDLLPLETSQAAKDRYMEVFELEAIRPAADEQDYTNDWQTKVSEDDKLVPNRLVGALEQIFTDEQMDVVRNARQAVRDGFDSVTGWRASFTLREFASPSPQNMWFKYPRHVYDDTDMLKDCSPEGDVSRPAWQKKQKKPKPSKALEFKQIVTFDPNERWTVEKAMERMDASKRTIRRYLTELGWTTENGIIVVDPTAKNGEDTDEAIPF